MVFTFTLRKFRKDGRGRDGEGKGEGGGGGGNGFKPPWFSTMNGHLFPKKSKYGNVIQAMYRPICIWRVARTYEPGWIGGISNGP